VHEQKTHAYGYSWKAWPIKTHAVFEMLVGLAEAIESVMIEASF
jgi:hypothetical protein